MLLTRTSRAEFTGNVISFFIVLCVECYYLLNFVVAKLQQNKEVSFQKWNKFVNNQ
jgi:hypothetical protein